jgi:hypothetical protein
MLLLVRTTGALVPSTVGNILHSIHRNVLTCLSGGETCQRRSLEPSAKRNKKGKRVRENEKRWKINERGGRWR